MNELIKVKAHETLIQTVDARELHEFLGSKQRFSDWIKNRIAQYGFTQGFDFITNHNSMTSPPSLEYHISVEMAKELAMVERNEKGKQARQYFIECERKALHNSEFQIPQTLPEALRLAADLAEKLSVTEAALEKAAPKAAALDRIATAKGSFCITEAAKILQMQPKKLFEWLCDNRWIYRRTGNKRWLGYQERITHHFIEHKVSSIELNDGRTKIAEQVRLTAKGISRIADFINQSRQLMLH